jgi:hypothetical protein
MRKKETMKKVIVWMVVVLLSGCFAPPPYEQKIEGFVFRDGKAASGVKVRFVSNAPETRENRGLETITDNEGKFSFTQKYSPEWSEKIDVIIHPYRLYIFIDGRWQTAWSLTTGPAPRSVSFKCYLDTKMKKVEKCLASWEKQPFE